MKKVHLLDDQTFQDGGPQADQARRRQIPSWAIGAIGAIGAVTKTPPKFALQNPANPGVSDPAFAVLKDTRENHIGAGSGHRRWAEQIVGFAA